MRSLLCLALLSSCGYNWQEHERPSLSIPFIKGDDDGTLTSEITQTLAASGLVDIVSKGGLYTLKIHIVNAPNETIGFRIDPQKIDGDVQQTLLATEGRKSMQLEAYLYRGEELAFGPYKIKASAEYDYVDGDSLQDLTFTNPKGETIVVLPFSLGQLESLESAQEAATRPLYTRLAQKVRDVLSLDL